jgi:hypothetical protein
LMVTVERWTLPAAFEAPRVARRLARTYAAAQGAPDETLAAIALCVSEAVTNVVVRAYREAEPGALELEARRPAAISAFTCEIEARGSRHGWTVLGQGWGCRSSATAQPLSSCADQQPAEQRSRCDSILPIPQPPRPADSQLASALALSGQAHRRRRGHSDASTLCLEEAPACSSFPATQAVTSASRRSFGAQRALLPRVASRCELPQRARLCGGSPSSLERSHRKLIERGYVDA